MVCFYVLGAFERPPTTLFPCMLWSSNEFEQTNKRIWWRIEGLNAEVQSLRVICCTWRSEVIWDGLTNPLSLCSVVRWGASYNEQDVRAQTSWWRSFFRSFFLILYTCFFILFFDSFRSSGAVSARFGRPPILGGSSGVEGDGSPPHLSYGDATVMQLTRGRY